jgi:hypothetical protein
MICIVTQGTIEADSPKCLATHDPAAGWSCVDPCLQEVESGLWCGLTDHFSTYAIVATPGALGCQGN